MSQLCSQLRCQQEIAVSGEGQPPEPLVPGWGRWGADLVHRQRGGRLHSVDLLWMVSPEAGVVVLRCEQVLFVDLQLGLGFGPLGLGLDLGFGHLGICLDLVFKVRRGFEDLLRFVSLEAGVVVQSLGFRV